MSSDGNGSVPRFDENGSLVGYGCASCETNLEVLQACVKNKILTIPQALSMMSKNVAKYLNLNGKGEIKVGFDADFAVFDEAFNLDSVIAKGGVLRKRGKASKKGIF